jgi:hypothetical protein
MTPSLPTQLVPFIHTVGQNAVQDVLDLLDRARAPYGSCLRVLRRSARLVPTGFVPLALASTLLVGAAAVHEYARDRGSGTTRRQRTHLSEIRIAYSGPQAVDP